MIWWDPNATGPDEVGNEGKGLYRYADGGRATCPGQWPTTKVGLFDDATSTTVLTSLPAADQPPSYPSPASELEPCSSPCPSRHRYRRIDPGIAGLPADR